MYSIRTDPNVKYRLEGSPSEVFLWKGLGKFFSSVEQLFSKGSQRTIKVNLQRHLFLAHSACGPRIRINTNWGFASESPLPKNVSIV